MNFFKRRRILKQTNALDLIPVHNCEHRIEEDQTVTILVPRFKSETMYRFLPKNRSRHFYIHLDKPGTTVWLEIDGINDVRKICNILSGSEGEEFVQTEKRVLKFLSRLYEERYISFKQLES